jgi:hypothetical protein
MIILDESLIDQRNRVMLACTGYRLIKVHPTLSQAIETFLNTLPLSTPSLMWNDPCQRATLFSEFSEVIKAHTELEFIHAFNKVHVDPKTHDIYRLLTEQNARRQNAQKHHQLRDASTPLDLAYSLPHHLHTHIMRFLSQPLANIKLPAMPPSSSSSQARPLSVYAWEPDDLYKAFNYQTLSDLEFWTNPSDYRYADKLKAAFDPDRKIRMATWQKYFKKVFTSSWLYDHVISLGLTPEFPDSINLLPLDASRDAQQQEPRVLSDLMMLYQNLDIPRRAERREWDEIEEEAVGYYPDPIQRRSYFVQSRPRLFYDCWGIPRSLKVKILLLPSALPSQLEGVRTNKDDFVRDLTGLRDPFKLDKIQGALVYASKTITLPSHVAIPVDVEARKPGKMKASTLKVTKPKQPKAPKQPKIKEEVDTTPDPNTKFW